MNVKSSSFQKLALIVLSVLFYCSPAFASTLFYDGSFTSGGVNSSVNPPDEFGILFRIDEVSGSTLLSNTDPNTRFDVSNSGDVLEFLPGTSSFDNFVLGITNGNNDTIRRVATYFSGGAVTSGGSQVRTEQQFFDANTLVGSIPRLNGIDFEGFTIDRITITWDSITHFDMTTQTGLRYSSSLQLYGTPPAAVPEPGTLLLLATGGLLGRKLKRK